MFMIVFNNYSILYTDSFSGFLAEIKKMNKNHNREFTVKITECDYGNIIFVDVQNKD